MGLAFTDHRKSIIFRREFPQFREIIERSIEIMGGDQYFNSSSKMWKLPDGRIVEFGAVEKVGDTRKYQGRPHDLICFDEVTQFTYMQYITLIAWNRTADPAQRCRIVAGTNPPLGDSKDHIGMWVFDYWGAWIRKDHPNPAAPGEVRWYVMKGNESYEVSGPEATERDGGMVLEPLSRTYIPGTVEDNPYYANTEYHKRLMNIPEPLRSKLLLGDASTVMSDDEWQVIPTAWVEAAQERWTPDRPMDDFGRSMPFDAYGVDPARGGMDKMTMVGRCGDWYSEVKAIPGQKVEDGKKGAAFVMKHLDPQSNPTIYVDVIGIGASVYDFLADNDNLIVKALNSAAKSKKTDKTKRFKFVNKRAELWWKLREALDPESDHEIALPPGRELLVDLTAPRFEVKSNGIQIEPKDKIKERIGRSPDTGEAVVYASDLTSLWVVV